MKKLISIILVLAALFGIVAAGLSAKAALDTKDHYSKAGEENDKNMKAFDDGLAQLEENEQAYLDGRTTLEAGKQQYEAGKAQYDEGKAQYEAGKASLEQAKQVIEGVEQLQTGYASWQEGYNGLVALAEQAGLEAPSAENVAAYDAAIEQAGVEALKGVPQAVADGKAQLGEGLTALIEGLMADETMGAAIAQASGMSADQISQTMAALPQLPYDQFNGAMNGFMQAAAPLSDGVKQQVEQGETALADAEAQLAAAETQLADAEKQIADGEAQLKAFEDGRDQIIGAASQVVANPADKGLKSIADRLGEGFTFVKENGDLDIPAAKKVSEAWHAYSDDSGKAITKEVVTRVIGAALILLASLIALFAGIKGLRGKGGKVVSCIAFLLSGAGVAALFIGGSYFTDKAAEAAKFNTFAPIILAGGIAVAAVALIHTFSAPKKN